MPYYIYERSIKDDKVFLAWNEVEVSLAGCNNGIIPKELEKNLLPSHNPPLGWSIHISKIFNEQNKSLHIQ